MERTKVALLISTSLGLLIFSGCQQKVSTQQKIEEESTIMSKKEIIEPSSNEAAESSKQTFPQGTLLQAVSDNDMRTVQEILATDYRINEVNEKGESPLLIATHQNFIEIAKQLIDAGADINQQDQISDSPYLYAGAQGKTEILAYMLEKATPDQQKVNRFGGNALIPAAEKGHLENVKLLLKDGRSNIDHQNNYGYTALIEAVALRDGSEIYQQIVQVLVEAGADKTLRDNTGRTAEDYAKSLGYSEMLSILNVN